MALLSCATISSSQGLVHSDLPLFTKENDGLQPYHFSEGQDFGCASRVAMGDWKYVEQREEANSDVGWMRLRNYGVFHCAMIEEWSFEREKLGQHGLKYSWFVPLGRTKRGGADVELWAIQSGARPGSDYKLLAHTPSAGLIKAFEVLPIECPPESLRKGRGPDIWIGDYCAINSADALRSLAKRMARRNSVATLVYVGPSLEGSDED